jgi:opacity protein-like surface antigen
MRTHRVCFAFGWGAAVLMAAMPTAAGAQLTWLLGGGGSYASDVPSGVQNIGMGYNVLAGVSAPIPLLPLAIRVDVQYDQQAQPQSINRLQVYSATANVQYGLLHLAVFEPYVIGGLGYYHILSRYGGCPGFCSAEVQPSSNGFGLNAGFGVKAAIGRVGLFGEWRYHDVFAPASDSPFGNGSYAPFTIGVTF